MKQKTKQFEKFEPNLQKAIIRMFDDIGFYDIEYIKDKDFSKEWYLDYTWTKREQENYIEWLATFLMKNWQGILKRKPFGKKDSRKAATEFVMNYGFITRELKIDDFIRIVGWSDVKNTMSKEEYKRFCEWMRGQTCPMDGVYTWDLERFLNNLSVID